MNTKIQRTIKYALAAVLTAAGFSAMAQPKASYQVIPLPNSIVSNQGEPFVLQQGVSIRCDAALQTEAQLLAQYIKQSTGITVELDGKGTPIVLHASLSHANREAYRLTVCADSIVINGASAAGTFRGINTLRKSLPQSPSQQVAMPAATITDAPRFAYRGMMFDVSRHFYGVDEVKQFIDMLALHNMNTFHWHLTDDQGWRIEIKKYPRLTEVGSMRTQTVIGRNPGKWDGVPHGGFYTQEQVRDVIRYAAERHIEVIPEIDMPGHMRAALAAYPHLGCTGGPYDVWTQWGVSDEVLCVGNDSTMQFISDVLNEIIDLFPSQYIHIGGDECPKIRWKECPRCQARIAREGITAKGKFSADDRLQGYITRFAYNVIKQRGRTMIGWDEVLECDVPSDAIVTSWRGDAGAIDGARRGNRVILSPNTHLYFDFYQSKETQFEPFAIGGFIPVERVYSFEPVPKQLNAAESALVLGAQANLWTEYIPTFSQVQYMAMPRVAALAEVLWTDARHKNYNDFLDRVPALFATYDALGYNYARHLADISPKYTPKTDAHALEVTLTTLKGRTIHYTLDGTKPTEQSPVYTRPFTIGASSILRAVSMAGGKLSRELVDTVTVNGVATFCPVTFNSQPNENYAFDGAPTLTDGLVGNGNYRTGRWIGFVGNDCDVTIDLGKATKVSQVDFNCCIFQCDGVVDAAGIEVLGSTDGKKFAPMFQKDYPEISREQEFGVARHSEQFKARRVRYVRVIVKSVKQLPAWHVFPNSNAFVFVDEITLK